MHRTSMSVPSIPKSVLEGGRVEGSGMFVAICGVVLPAKCRKQGDGCYFVRVTVSISIVAYGADKMPPSWRRGYLRRSTCA